MDPINNYKNQNLNHLILSPFPSKLEGKRTLDLEVSLPVSRLMGQSYDWAHN